LKFITSEHILKLQLTSPGNHQIIIISFAQLPMTVVIWSLIIWFSSPLGIFGQPYWLHTVQGNKLAT